MQYINFCVFEKNAVKGWNLLGNVLENILILAHKIKDGLSNYVNIWHV
jgi:hypothetical protein